MDLVNVVGVQFRRAGKIYDFAAGEQPLRVGDDVVVDTDRGLSLAKVARLRFVDRGVYKDGGLKPIVRKASHKDLEVAGKLSAEQAEQFARDRVSQLSLDMRIMKAEVQFSGNKAIIYFSAPGRVDFRDLVKDLAGGLKTRVELKQVGARDEAKLIGGIGICGREFCCSSFLREFVPVSIKMAKNQNLALNPTKISGGCGRLLCCLTYEDETYKYLAKQMPPRGTRARVVADDVFGDVLKSDVINQMVLLEMDDGRQMAVKIKDIEIVEKGSGQEAGDDWGEDLDLDDLSALAEGDRRPSSRPEGQGERSGQGGGNPPSRGREPRRDGGPSRGQEPRRDGGPSRGQEPRRDGGPSRGQEPRRDGGPSRGQEPRRDGNPQPPRSSEPRPEAGTPQAPAAADEGGQPRGTDEQGGRRSGRGRRGGRRNRNKNRKQE